MTGKMEVRLENAGPALKKKSIEDITKGEIWEGHFDKLARVRGVGWCFQNLILNKYIA